MLRQRVAASSNKVDYSLTIDQYGPTTCETSGWFKYNVFTYLQLKSTSESDTPDQLFRPNFIVFRFFFQSMKKKRVMLVSVFWLALGGSLRASHYKTRTFFLIVRAEQYGAEEAPLCTPRVKWTWTRLINVNVSLTSEREHSNVESVGLLNGK